MTIREYTEFDLREIMNLYSSAGWVNYTRNPQVLVSAYKNSLLTLGAYDDDGKLVGIIRVVGDGASIVFVQDLLVLPEYRRRGIGSRLLDHVICHYNDVYQMELLTDDTPETKAFYQSHGFVKVEDAGMSAFMKK